MLAWPELIGRLALATVLGALVGAERERRERAAGLRTHALVGVGSALFIIVSAFGFTDVLGTPNVVLDPSRVAAQVASGVGFLGAGTIILRRNTVRGLTTAASVWAVAAIGLAIGGGLYVAGVATAALTLAVLAGLRPIEARWFRNRRGVRIVLLVEHRAAALASIDAAAEAAAVPVRGWTIETRYHEGIDRVEVSLDSTARERAVAAAAALSRIEGVREVRLRSDRRRRGG